MTRIFSKQAIDLGRATRLLALTVALGTPALAQAAIRCIENESQFKSILDAALASADTVEEVRIKSGVYQFSTGEIGYFGVLQGSGKTLSIRGGWSGNAGMCTVQNGDATATVLSGNNQRPVFVINASTTFTGSITIENMAFTAGRTTSGQTASALGLGEQNGGVMGVLLDRVWIEGNTTQAGVSAAALQVTCESGVVVRNSLVAGNTSGSSPPASIVVGAGQSNLVLNNTFAFNSSSSPLGNAGLFLALSPGASLLLANNLFHGNIATAAPRVDIRLATAGISLQNNRYTGLFGVPASETGSSTGPAGFNGSGYDLAASSTARDAGALFVPLLQGAFDAAGNRRVQGSAVDLGALEYSDVFRDGFE